MKNLDYLRAELSMARSQGVKKVLADVGELQSALHALHGYEEGERPKLLGYASGVESRNLITGNRNYLKIRRKKTVIHNTAIYFLTLPELTDEERLRLLGLARTEQPESVAEVEPVEA